MNYKKYIKTTDIDAFLETNGFQQEVEQEFYEYVEFYFTELDNDEHFETEEDVIRAFKTVKKYVIAFDNSYKKGYSKAWNKVWADKQSEYLPDDVFKDCYDASKQQSPELAEKDLELFCKAHNGDELFLKHLKTLANHGWSDGVLLPEEEAKLYSKIYKEQIAGGKSEMYADVYARNLAEEPNSLTYCDKLAQTYENCILKGMKKDDALAVAYKNCDEEGRF